MLVDKDIHPENDIYYIGGQLIHSLKLFDGKVIDFFDLYQSVKSKFNVSIGLFLLAMDWLYLLGLIKLDKSGEIEKCF